MLKFKNISKSFKTDFWSKRITVLDGLTFSLEKGKATGFLGANGAGKTTSFKIVFQLSAQASGSVAFDNSLGSEFHEILKNIGYMPERPYFHPHLSCHEFLSYMGQLQDMGGKNLNESIDFWLNKMGLEGAKNRKVKGLSKGMLQRLGFAAALIHNPELIILDEPMAGLDPQGRLEFKNIMKDLVAEGKTLFFSSHIVSDIEEVCENVVIIEKGKLLYEGKVSRILNDAGSDGFEITVLMEQGSNFKQPLHSVVDGAMMRAYYQVSKREKREFLKTCLEKGYEILRVDEKRPSLEEIVYHIR